MMIASNIIIVTSGMIVMGLMAMEHTDGGMPDRMGSVKNHSFHRRTDLPHTPHRRPSYFGYTSRQFGLLLLLIVLVLVIVVRLGLRSIVAFAAAIVVQIVDTEVALDGVASIRHCSRERRMLLFSTHICLPLQLLMIIVQVLLRRDTEQVILL
jgi:hypothetical protein